MKTFKRALWLMVASTCLLWTAQAHAAPITWTLSGVVFNDGGTASGTFDFDADTGTYSNISIITTGGTALPGSFYFAEPTSGGNQTFFRFVNSVLADLTGANFFDFAWGPPGALTNAGGVLTEEPAFISGEGFCNDANCFGKTFLRTTTVGQVSAPNPAPEPGTLALIGLGIAGLALTRRRKRRA